MALSSWTIETPLGDMIGMDDGISLLVLDFLIKPYGDFKKPTWVKNSVIAHEETPLKKQVQREMHAYFKGVLRTFQTPLSPHGTPFQKRAWEGLCTIPYAETRTYGEQASIIANPKAVRATGSANGKNPISILIPCHRVIGAKGGLGGYNSGLDRKKWLLEFEALPHFVTK